MTTTVRIEAHCSPNKRAVVTVRETGVLPTQTVLRDGESLEVYVHDDKQVIVKEVAVEDGR